MDKGVMKLYRMERALYLRKIPMLPKLIKMIIRVTCAATIPYTAKIGKNCIFPHGGQGVVIHDEAEIGEGCIIQCNAVIGGRGGRPGAPHIGNDCLIGTGAAVLGAIQIGNNVAVGANAVVIKSIPDNSVVVGVPGKIIKRLDANTGAKGIGYQASNK